MSNQNGGGLVWIPMLSLCIGSGASALYFLQNEPNAIIGYLLMVLCVLSFVWLFEDL